MAPVTDAELAAAEARGAAMLAAQPRAVAARYEPATRKVMVDLANGCSYVFPADLVQDLNGSDDAKLSKIVVDGAGFNLHWPLLDADLFVPALVAGLFGNRDWMMREMARQAGRAKSPSKASA